MKIGPRLMKIGNHMDLFTEDWGEIGKDRVFFFGNTSSYSLLVIVL